MLHLLQVVVQELGGGRDGLADVGLDVVEIDVLGGVQPDDLLGPVAAVYSAVANSGDQRQGQDERCHSRRLLETCATRQALDQHVEYRLTELGKTLQEPLAAICAWAAAHPNG